MSANFTLPQLNQRVLSTLNQDGTRRWMSPRQARGRFWSARAVVAWTLIAIFTAMPWTSMHGKPPILLDLTTRHFTFFGTTFRPTETLLLALLTLAIFVTVFLVTALLGRVWCGWGCPQTIYMEFVYRPIERLCIGDQSAKQRAPVAVWRRLLMYFIFLALSAHLANTFLAYFVGTEKLVEWTFRSPADHPVAFGVFAATVALMMFDFVFFREQLCTLVCPYGRFQSVLLDKDSLVIGYDSARGEPRANAIHRRALESKQERAGDCVECTKCVQVCPTGIDIREGLQLECVNCAQCIDACDEVMDKLGKSRGLIRYTTQNILEGRKRKRIRYRLLAYPILLTAIVTALVTLLAAREPAWIEQVRLTGLNFTTTPVGEIASPVRILIENRSDTAQEFEVVSTPTVRLRDSVARVVIEADEAATIDLTVLSEASAFHRGRRNGEVTVRSSDGFEKSIALAIAGPFTMEK